MKRAKGLVSASIGLYLLEKPYSFGASPFEILIFYLSV